MVLNLGVRVDTDNEVVSHSLGLAKGIKMTLLQVEWRKDEWWSADMWTCSFQLMPSSVLQLGCKDEKGLQITKWVTSKHPSTQMRMGFLFCSVVAMMCECGGVCV